MADLIIYTSKGIMIVEVEFNRDFWEAMLKKLTTFYKDYLVPKLLTWKMYKQLSWIHRVHAALTLFFSFWSWNNLHLLIF